MIKLIASDMDGTLLDEEKKFPPDFTGILKRLEQQNIRFVVASGRSYSAIKFMFDDIKQDIIFICDNGAFIVIDGKVTSISAIPHETINSILRSSKQLNGVFPVLCGANGIYIPSYSDDEFIREFDVYYTAPTVCDDLSNINDTIFKIAVFDRHNPINNSFPILNKELGDRLSIQISGEHWMDIMNQGISKGAALADIKKLLGIKTEETMAFGDFYNDISLLREAEYSYVMENANDDMKQYGKFTASSNRKYGVTKAISEYLNKHITA